MSDRPRETDFSAVRTIPIAGRASKVRAEEFASPPGPRPSFHDFLGSLPDILVARDFLKVVEAVAAAARGGFQLARDVEHIGRQAFYARKFFH